MDIRYSRRRFARLLDLTEQELSDVEARSELSQIRDPSEGYYPLHLSAYRSVLGLRPPPTKPRRQLFLNFKGGTGKTSLSVSYAFRLAEQGYRVLVIDLDSQGHATQCLGFEGEKYEHTIADVLVKRAPISDVIVRTPLVELELIPANLGMSTIDISLMPLPGREHRLKRALEDIAGRHDFVVLDAPPSFGLLNLNALMAADDLFVPVLPDFLSFHGLKLLFETVGELEEDLGHSLDRIFIVLNQYNPTTKIAQEAKAALETHYPEFMLNTIVRQCTRFAQASSEGLPVSAYDPSSKGAEDIEAIIAEVMQTSTEETAQEEKSA